MAIKSIKGLIGEITTIQKIAKTGKPYQIFKVKVANDPQNRTFSAMFHLPKSVVQGKVCQFYYEIKQTVGRNGQQFTNYNIVEKSTDSSIPSIQIDDTPTTPSVPFANPDTTIVKVLKALIEIRDLLKNTEVKKTTQSPVQQPIPVQSEQDKLAEEVFGPPIENGEDSNGTSEEINVEEIEF